MSPIGSLLSELDERTIARNVGIPHDEARMGYNPGRTTVPDIDTFYDILGDYYAHHHSQCVSRGGRLSRSEARSFAKEIVTREYERNHSNINGAFCDARDGTNGGLRRILDTIAESLKAKSTENYIRDAFDRHVATNSWEEQVEIIREFIAECGAYLRSDIRAGQPERYARDYEQLIRAYVQGLRSTSSVFRRL
ncbi:MAG: hypothetical protein NTW86_15575 [Candidatus Sumerlaeota bacterium]|nr:hypothetical protein [Candidatus Sumerlaeota bacterium]